MGRSAAVKTRLLLDTDIDITGDIDDAMCLAYLLAQPACDLLGITTVTWDTDRRAMVASALCRAAGRTVPIFPGARVPLVAPLPVFASEQTVDVEGEFLRGWDHEEVFPHGRAVEFMRQTIRTHPGEVVLLGVGPLTNIALLFAVDPDIPALLKGLALMAGRFTDRAADAPPREWNAQLDPHAAAIVYRAHVARHRSVGLDVTHALRLDAAAVRRELANTSPLLRAMAELWFRKAPGITFHDPLAAAAIFEPQLCAWSRGAVAVELEDEQRRGLTRWARHASGPHEVATDVDEPGFFAHYFSVLRAGFGA
jgi:inosine-uridine nucleoside N-ribohydrolase